MLDLQNCIVVMQFMILPRLWVVGPAITTRAKKVIWRLSKPFWRAVKNYSTPTF